METMPAAYAAKDALLRELQHPRLLQMQLAEEVCEELMAADFFFHPFQNVEGLEAAHLLAPPGFLALLVRGQVGAHHQRVAVVQCVQLQVLQGAMLWWQASWGEDPRRVAAGDCIQLLPGEEHGFVVLEDVLNYNLMFSAPYPQNP